MEKSRLKNTHTEDLVAEYQNSGDPVLLEDIIGRNKKLLLKITFQYKNSGHNIEDLLQMAYIGLLVAINRFKKEKENKFSTFAYYCIKGEIQHSLRDNNLINTPRWLIKLNEIFNRFVKDFESNNGRYPSKDEISKGINVSLESIDEILRSREISIYNNSRKEDNNQDADIIDRSLIKSRSPKSFELVMEDRITLWDAVDRLKGLNKKIIVLKYIFGFSQKEIGRKVGLSQRNVSRKIQDSLEKMRDDLS